MRILVCDDSPLMRQMLREIVEPEGFEVVGEANDGLEALSLHRSLLPDLVILDLLMPGISGREALQGLLEIDASARVVVCGSLGQEELIAQALRGGARDFVVKPFFPDRVLGALANAVDKPAPPWARSAQPHA